MLKYKNKLNILTFGYLPFKNFYNIKHNFYQFFKNIKYAYQRIIRGYADCDRWNIDNYIAYLLPAMLLDLKEYGMGFPERIASFEEWQKILEEMANHFHNTLEWEEDIPINQEIAKAYEKTEMDEKDRETWIELEKKAEKFREAEKDLACDMFKKWFFYLWD